MKSNENLTKDLLFTILLGMVSIILIILPYINDPGSNSDEIAKPPGQVMVEIFWNDNIDIDIDGWVLGPKDKTPVGFVNKDGTQFDLLRDDVGKSNDVSGRNFETFYSRGMFEGEYIVNVHWYAGSAVNSLDVTIIVTVYDLDKRSQQQILKRDIMLSHNEDKNVFVFRLDKKGKLIKNSVHEDQNIKLKESVNNEQPPLTDGITGR